ncbi:MAG: GtrA family protein [Eubacterium sp.]|nr:GtrA family protein [Eubacterium sp.]
MTRMAAVLWNWIERISLWFLGLFCRLFGKGQTKETEEAFLQFVRFGIVGVSNTAAHYVIYAATLFFLQSHGWLKDVDYLVATAIAFALSVLWSFFWNYKFVFTLEEGERRPVFPALVKTYVSYSFTGLFLNSILMLFWVQAVHISEYIAPVFNLLISVPINFLMNKFWAFKKER